MDFTTEEFNSVNYARNFAMQHSSTSTILTITAVGQGRHSSCKIQKVQSVILGQAYEKEFKSLTDTLLNYNQDNFVYSFATN